MRQKKTVGDSFGTSNSEIPFLFLGREKDLSKALKIEVFEVLVLSSLLYNSETWVIKATSRNRLKVFEVACLQKIEGVSRRDRIRNTEIQNRLN